MCSKTFLPWVWLGAALLAGAARGQTVVLEENVASANDYVALSEVARLEGGSGATLSRFAEIYLGPVPGVYDREFIRSRMSRHGFDVAGLVFAGAEAVRVEHARSSAPARLPGSDPKAAGISVREDSRKLVERAVEDHVRQWVGNRVEDAEVEVGRIDWPQGISAGDRIESAWVAEEGVPERGNALFHVRVRTSEGRTFDVSVEASPRYYVRQIVARTDLAKGRVLVRSDLSSRIVATDDPIAGETSDPDALVGKRLAAPVTAGKPVLFARVEAVPVVRKGSRVRVIYRGDGFTIESIAKAQEDAAIGDAVLVQNPSSRKEFRARAIGPGTVEISASEPTGNNER
ncbi:MAG: flagellar basal body P-ring formation protein FlgA [Planctomycetes bacterium]|nr:flagellar basal body P-ring formation protein FlgA [Planctomycetota bacterium]